MLDGEGEKGRLNCSKKEIRLEVRLSRPGVPKTFPSERATCHEVSISDRGPELFCHYENFVFCSDGWGWVTFKFHDWGKVRFPHFHESRSRGRKRTKCTKNKQRKEKGFLSSIVQGAGSNAWGGRA